MGVAFSIGLVVYGALAFALAVPVFVVARRHDKPGTVRRFTYGAIGVATACALLAAGTHDLREACDEAGYNLSYACLDVGAAGLQMLFIGGFAAVSWLAAYFIAKE